MSAYFPDRVELLRMNITILQVFTKSNLVILIVDSNIGILNHVAVFCFDMRMAGCGKFIFFQVINGGCKSHILQCIKIKIPAAVVKGIEDDQRSDHRENPECKA